jgi:chromosome segregation ATPase
MEQRGGYSSASKLNKRNKIVNVPKFYNFKHRALQLHNELQTRTAELHSHQRAMVELLDHIAKLEKHASVQTDKMETKENEIVAATFKLRSVQESEAENQLVIEKLTLLQSRQKVSVAVLTW